MAEMELTLKNIQHKLKAAEKLKKLDHHKKTNMAAIDTAKCFLALSQDSLLMRQ